jgi:predicted esterase
MWSWSSYNARVPSTAASVHTISIGSHGRYWVRPASGDPAGVLVGCHGYGQSAESFAADLEAIPGIERWLLVSVQGLHRFYTRAGAVVASWMTSQDRELMIADNIAYLRQVVERMGAEHAPVLAPAAPLVFLGFSQGVAMAFRAAADHADCAGIIALGGDVPPDVRAAATSLPPVLLGRGTDEEWYTQERMQTDVAWLQGIGTDLSVCEYAGGHEWTAAFREAAAAFLNRIAASSPGGEQRR